MLQEMPTPQGAHPHAAQAPPGTAEQTNLQQMKALVFLSWDLEVVKDFLSL